MTQKEVPMSTNIIPFEFESHMVRAVSVDGEPWFVAADVARVLGYRMASDMTRRLDDEDKGTRSMRTPSGDQEMTIISEPGLYVAVLGSKVPGARAFKRWITHEVIPAIRKTGGYTVQPALTEDEIVAQALQITTAKVKQLEAKVEADAPKVEYVDRFVAVDDDVLTVRDAAQALGVKESELRQAFTDWGWAYRKTIGRQFSNRRGEVVDLHEWRAYAEHKGKFQLRPQHNAPRYHNGQVKQTLYVKTSVLPVIADRLGLDDEYLIDEVA